MTENEKAGIKALLTMLLVKHGERGFDAVEIPVMAEFLRQAGYEIPRSIHRDMYDRHLIRFASINSWLYVVADKGKEFIDE